MHAVHVTFKMLTLSESRGTLVTRKWFFATVNSPVNVEVAAVGESLVAVVARVGFLTRVNSSVHIELIQLPKFLGTV